MTSLLYLLRLLASAALQTYGGCLAITFSNVTVRDSRFDSNSCDFIGGAIHVDRASALYAYNSTFNNNTVSSAAFMHMFCKCLL